MRRFLIRAAVALYAFTAGVLAAGILGSPRHQPTRWFSEKQTISSYSAALLYTCCLLSAFNYLTTKDCRPRSGLPCRIKRFWALAVAGFFLLMLDEYFVLHEGLDNLFTYRLLGLTPSPFLDKLDVLVLVAYGVVALGFLTYYRQELRAVRGFFGFIAAGGIFAAVSLGLDLLDDTVAKVYVEEGTKIFANASFVLACLTAAAKNYVSIQARH